jgi:hypothetical protein
LYLKENKNTRIDYLTENLRSVRVIIFIAITYGTILIAEEKRPCIDDQAFHDLQNIEKFIIEDKKNTIIIARYV